MTELCVPLLWLDHRLAITFVLICSHPIWKPVLTAYLRGASLRSRYSPYVVTVTIICYEVFFRDILPALPTKYPTFCSLHVLFPYPFGSGEAV
jgi:hypothetical protein